MEPPPKVGTEAVNHLYDRLNREAEDKGYHLNPDVEFTKDLVRSLLINENRFGYRVCPCRLALGKKDDDLDIICPCDYRDQDLEEFGACYCGLYVDEEILSGRKQLTTIPERRTTPDQRHIVATEPAKPSFAPFALPVWRCRVCGYLCARDQPPAVCPVCKAKKDRFERFA
jgi:ferredoxin-thioredoxin reductase catalytic subunit/rubredoxin